ncbi:hypothetical protein R1sor_008081 [Riccia sorocarpa]|uniref:Uncharacterized protein n=1 Tax=Riccia sorocarpa TaxID=122646 RepID=A0ABD3HWE6_9MARC
MAPKTRNVGRKRKERSPIVEFPPEDAMELIDLIVSKIVETAEEGESSKHNSVETAEEGKSSKHNSAAAASTTIEVYRPPGALQALVDARGVVTLEELSLLERDEVYPYLDLSHLQHDKGFVNISFALFSRGTRPGIDVYTVDLSDSGLKKLVDFPAMGPCSRVVPGSVIEKHFLDQLGTTVAFLAIAHVDPELDNLRPDWHAWCANEIRFRLRHSKTDKHSKAKFREGWEAVVELVTRDFLARQAARLQQQSQVLQLEYSSDAKNAFAETKVVWDAERGELIAERERLRTELEEAQSREEKEEWEARNQKLSEDISVLHEERLRITTKEDNVQGELAQIRSLLQQPRESSDVGDVGELKKQLEEKEEQLERLKEADAKVVKKLRLAKKKGQSMEKELSKMPAGLMCSASIPLAWVKEFALVRELNLKALQERMLCSVDMRSLPPSQFGDSDDLQIVGIPTMRLQKKKYLDSLHQELSDKICAFIRSFKQGSRLKLYPPPHRVTGTQFKKWSHMENGVKISDWTYLWDYPSDKCWIFSAKGTRGETTCHNRALVTVAIDVPRGDDALQMLCKINMALCIRLRPWDEHLDHFPQALLVIPWALDILNTLVEKQLVTVWRT